ncbi:MAG: 50S ribosomal protein L25 [Acidobacteria bacterium]|nr:50S ribosomal protein L25 [Acidobacteriota bacterium]
MPEVTLVAESGRPAGTSSSKRLRLEGRVPGVVYGHGIDPLPVSVDRKGLRAVLHTDAGQNALINLEVGGGTSHLTIVKELQRHPVRNDVVHVDFIVVSRDEVVTVDVPIMLIGEAKQVLANDGTVDQSMHSLTIHAKPGNIPNEIEIDVSELAIGDSVRVGDLKLPAGVTTDVDGEEPVVVAQVSAVAVEAEQLEELAEAIHEAEAAEATGEGEADAGEAPAAEASEEG